MASSSMIQVAATSLDTAGISLCTAPASASNPRMGTMFNAATLAAAQPIWFHSMYNGDWLMINSRTWTAAAPIGGTPGGYSSFTEATTPQWVIVDGPTGATTSVPNAAGGIPMLTSSSGTVVTGAASRSQDSLWLLNSINGGTGAVLQRFSVSPNGSVVLTHEDVIPNGPGSVVFDKGLQYDTPYLVAYGTDSSGHVYRARKLWAKVGVNKPSGKVASLSGNGNTLIGTQVGWEYYTGQGYSADSSELAPVVVSGGATWTTKGPMSFASYRNTNYATTVNVSGTTYTGQLWSSNQGRPYITIGSPLALGSSSDSSYLGGTVQFMGELPANPAASQMTNAAAGILFATSVRTAAGGGHILDTVWDIYAIAG